MGGSEWELRGRHDDLRACLDALDRDAPWAGVVLVGDAGIGKTRLVADVVAALGGGVPVEHAVATVGSAQIPFGAFAHLLDAASPDPSEGNDLLGSLRALRRALVDRGTDTGDRAVVVVDDAHHLDGASATLLVQLALTGEVRLVVAVRRGEACPADVTALWRDERCRRLDLEPLGAADVAALAGDVLGGPLERSSAAELHRTSGGNPLFLRELLDDARSGGRLSRHRGLWRWEGVAAGVRLRDLVGSHLDRLDPGAQRLVDVLAVGAPLPLAVAVELCGFGAVEDLEIAGIVAVDDAAGSPRLVVTQPLFTDVRSASFGPVRTASIVAELAEAMDVAESSHPDDLVRGVRWSMAAGRHVGGDRLLAACLLARAGGDIVAAEALARSAIAGGAGPAADLELAEILELDARPDAAWAVLAQLDARLPDAPRRARARVCAVRVLSHGLHDPDAARRIVDESAPIEDPTWQALVEAQWVTTLAMTDDIGAARDRAARLALDPSPLVRLRALSAVNLVDVADGALEDALERARAMVTVALAHRDEIPAGTAVVASALLLDLLLAGHHDETDVLLDMIGSDPSSALPSYRAFTLSARARCDLQRGDAAAARAAASESAALWAEGSDDQGFLPAVLGVLCAACALLGDADGAAAAAAEAATAVAASERRMLHTEVARLTAWEPLGGGDVTTAAGRLVDAADLARARGQRTFELLALHDAVRLGAPRRVRRRLVDVAPRVQGPLASAAAAHGIALLEGDAAALEEVAARFEALGCRLVAAEAYGAASRQHASDGVRSAARRAGRASAHLRGSLSGVRTPGLDVVLDVPALSARELQVARLAAGGATSRTIAEELGVSKRTVDNLLSRVYTKLGVSGRVELGPALDVRA